MEKEEPRSEEQSERDDPTTEEEETEHAQDGTDSTFFDTDQHSDAPGPFGTG